MALSKKQSAAILSTILLVGLGMYVLTPVLLGEDSEDDPSENPFTTPDNETDVENVDFEGVQVAGDGSVVLFAETIVNNHRTQLLNNSISLEYGSSTSEVQIRKQGNRILRTNTEQLRTVRSYSDGVLLYQITDLQGQSTYDAERRAIQNEQYHRSTFFNSIITDLDVRRLEDTDDGITVTMTGQDSLSNLNTVISEFNEINEAEAEIIISDSGVITNLQLEVIGPGLFGTPSTEQYYYNVSQIGGVEVQEPDWVSTVQSQTAIMSSSPDTENNWIRVEHNGLAAIESGSSISVLAADGEGSTVDIPTRVSSGDTIYFYPAEDGWSVSINQEPTPSGVITSGMDLILTISDESGSVEYYRETLSLGS